MTTRNTIAGAVVVAALMLAILASMTVGDGTTASAAPQAQPTPVSVTRPASPGAQVYEIWTNAVITADTTAACVDIGRASVIDAQYEIDQTATNTVTLTSQWSINGSLITDGVDFVTSNTADASALTQIQAFGRYICAQADVTNSSPVTVTLYLLAK